MQSMQRRFGKLLPRTADESQVAVLLKDFDDADKMLAKVRDLFPPPYIADSIADGVPVRSSMHQKHGAIRGETYWVRSNASFMDFRPCILPSLDRMKMIPVTNRS